MNIVKILCCIEEGEEKESIVVGSSIYYNENAYSIVRTIVIGSLEVWAF